MYMYTVNFSDLLLLLNYNFCHEIEYLKKKLQNKKTNL